MNCNWNYWFVGIIITAGVAAYAYYHQKKKAKLSFSDYCYGCEMIAGKEMVITDDVIKTILVLAKVDEQNVGPFLYRSYKDGKIKKKRVKYKTYPFSLCPKDIQDLISKGEYIIKKY